LTSHKLTSADKGKTISVKVTAKKTGYPTTTKQVGHKVS
jgi:hypothetical protein